MNAVIIDDEPIARKGIRILADQIPDLSIVGEYANSLLAQEHITDEVDLLFLDIEMPGLRGVDFLRAMPPKCHVILTTAYQEYALEAFELDVVDYLLKPIRLDRFAKAVQKVRDLMSLTHHEVDTSADQDHIYIKADRKYIRLALRDIRYIQGMKDYVILHTADDRYMTAMNIRTILRQLPEEIFCRVSKSYIINVESISTIETDAVIIHDVEIPLGPSYKADFISRHVNDKLIRR